MERNHQTEGDTKWKQITAFSDMHIKMLLFKR